MSVNFKLLNISINKSLVKYYTHNRQMSTYLQHLVCSLDTQTTPLLDFLMVVFRHSQHMVKVTVRL